MQNIFALQIREIYDRSCHAFGSMSMPWQISPAQSLPRLEERIVAGPEKTEQYIQETLIALFLMFPEDAEPPS